jgi:hypothetical protein
MTFQTVVRGGCGGLWLVFGIFTIILFYVLLVFDNSQKLKNSPTHHTFCHKKQFSCFSFVDSSKNKNLKKYQNPPPTHHFWSWSA